MRNLMRDQVDAYELLSNGWETLDGERALVRIVRFQVADSTPLVQLQAFLVRDGLGYAICGTATEAAFAEAEPAFRERARRPALRWRRATAASDALQVLRG